MEELRQEHPKLVIFAGVEVSAFEGHFLVYGVDNPFALPRGIRVAELCREVHAQGGAVVAAIRSVGISLSRKCCNAKSRSWTAWN